MLSPKQKRQLKALANPISLKYTIGKKEISDSFIDMIDKALTAKELIKISVLKTADAPIMEIAIDVANATKADIVDIIGKVIILYRKNPKIDGIKLN